MARLCALIALVAWLSPASAAWAQSSPGVLSAAEIRSGGTTGFGVSSGPPSIGGALEFRPWSGASRRIFVYGAGDFRHHGRRETFDEEFSVRAHVGRSVFLLGGALGVDVVRTARTTLAVRGGSTFLRDYTTFEVQTGNGFTNNPRDEWETVCSFAPYRERCPTVYAMRGTVAAGFRFTPRRNGAFYVGVDYTHLVGGQHVFVAVVGAQ